MERIKLAIAKARSSTDQLQAAHNESQVHEASPLFKPAVTPSMSRVDSPFDGAANKKPIKVGWPAAVLLAMVSVGAVWFLTRFEAGADPARPHESHDVPSASVPTGPLDSPPQPTALAQSEAIDRSELVSGTPSSVSAGVAGPEPASLLQEAQVAAAVEAWRLAWSARDMENYLDAYSRAFVPRGDVSRQDWVASRYRNVGERPSIDVVIRNFKIESLTQDSARVSFLQDYISGGFRELDQLKTLDLVREDNDRWRIVRESLGSIPPAR